MDFIIKFKIMINFYNAYFYLWLLKRRIHSQWEMEKDPSSSDFL